MEPVFTIHSYYDFEKFREFNRVYLRYVRKMWKHLLIRAALYLAFAGYSLVQYIRQPEPVYMMFCVFALVMIGLTWLLFTKKSERQIREAWQSNEELGDGMETTQNFYEDSYEEINKFTTLKVEYGDLTGGFESPDHIFWFHSRNQGIMIEKSACTEEQLAVIRGRTALKAIPAKK